MSEKSLAGVSILLLTTLALASNPQDEHVVRNAYAKVAYAAQARTVYVETSKNPNIPSSELATKLQADELRFEISEMTSGLLSDIAERPYSDFVSKPDTQEVLQIVFLEQRHGENGKRAVSYFAIPHWSPGEGSVENWDMPVKEAMVYSGNQGLYSRYVTATITVYFQGKSRTYRTLWLFSSSAMLPVDTVTGNAIVARFAKESAYPSVLTDTSMRSHTAVDNWLSSNQRFDAACKTGKKDVCCDSATGRCGVHSDDLRSTKPAPNTIAVPKKEGL